MSGTESSPTDLLLAWRRGDAAALDQLVPLVHEELRRLARRYMAQERPDHTLQPTALVNEAYLRLFDVHQVDWKNRGHFSPWRRGSCAASLWTPPVHMAASNVVTLTSDGVNDIPLWTSDGQRVIYARNAPPMGLLSVPAVQGATPEHISPEGHYHPHGWSSQGDLLTVRNSYSPTWWDILTLPGRSGSPPEQQLQTARNEGRGGAALSPDGRWLAYTFDGTGKDETWVAAYPGLRGPTPISSTGGADPVWAKDGRELYYLENRNLMAVPVQTTPVFRFDRPTKLFESPSGRAVFPNVSYDVARNGRFLMIKGGAPSATSPVQVALNWRAGITN